VWKEPTHAALPPAEAIAATVAEAGRTSRAAFRTVTTERGAPNLLIVVPPPGEGAGGAEFAGAVLDPNRPALAAVLGPGRAGERASVDVVDTEGRVFASSAPGADRPDSRPARGVRPAGDRRRGGRGRRLGALSVLPLSVVVRQERSDSSRRFAPRNAGSSSPRPSFSGSSSCSPGAPRGA